MSEDSEESSETSESTESTESTATETHDDLRTVVNSLAAKVDDLACTVESMAQIEQDSSPVKRPWTHWGN